ncbi:MBL fold metallo-hydrolase [Krasilnikoviella flava]|uniref:Glyoxylase, beta-lactamase superfamily II n=1 Tax=Krasilnikoviella flava TaxID=526729 RepID=A0A1T5LIT5_9MICO|nr:MBL fold metallo-hydrolase [Krasilnikoviella flava]SKC75892.1 Glyoxylase, beta-lactamase superfamily II [Krasilnikoviella flava]
MPQVTVVRADNPGPMTLDGTRSYVLRAPGSPSSVVVDPGPDDERHLATLAAEGPVGLVLITHRHADHTAGSARLRALTGAPVRAVDPEHCHGGEPLRGGERIDAAGVRVDVLATPGHTADSVSFVVTAPGEAPVVLTGDTVLGRGTTVIAEPDGSLRDYLASLDMLERVGDGRVGLPAHGPALDDLGDAVRAYRTHRLERLAQVREALAALGPAADADAVVAHVYADVDPSVRRAARQSVVAQLAYLRDEPA